MFIDIKYVYNYGDCLIYIKKEYFNECRDKNFF